MTVRDWLLYALLVAITAFWVVIVWAILKGVQG